MSEAELTLTELLGGEQIRAKLRSAIRAAAASAAAVLGPQDLRAILDQAEQALMSALNVNLNDILASAWSTVGKLREAADPARHKPDETVAVPLIEHSVRSKQEPELEFTYNGATVFTLACSVEVTLRLSGMVLRVRGGRIRQIASGTCSASAALSLAGAKLIEHTTRQINLPGRINLGSGIAIVGPQRQRAETPERAEVPPAAVALRVVAGILDLAVAMLALAALSAALVVSPDEVIPLGILLWMLTQLSPAVIGATPGMLSVGLHLTDESGADVTLRQMLLRTIMLLAAVFTFRLRPDREGRLLQDRVSGSRVISEDAIDLTAPAGPR